MDKRLLLASPHMSDEGYELEYIHDAFRKNWIAPLGENVNEFEKAMGEFMGKGYPVALSAGTAALHLAMILAGVKAGDTVFCQSLTFSASANPVAYCGAKPVFIDSERETWNMDPAALRRLALGGRQVAEHELCQPVRLPVLPDAVDVVHAAIDLTVRVVRQVGVDGALVKPQLAPVRGDLEHIVGAGVNKLGVYPCGALGQLLHHLLLYLRGLRHLVVIDGRGRRQVELV